MNVPAIKIDIFKERIVVPAGMNFIITRRIREGIDVKKPNAPLGIEEEKYFLYEFRDSSGYFKNENFMIKRDDAEIFNQLILTQTNSTRELCEAFEERGYNKGFNNGKSLGQTEAGELFKVLPWYKRLFYN